MLKLFAHTFSTAYVGVRRERERECPVPGLGAAPVQVSSQSIDSPYARCAGGVCLKNAAAALAKLSIQLLPCLSSTPAFIPLPLPLLLPSVLVCVVTLVVCFEP